MNNEKNKIKVALDFSIGKAFYYSFIAIVTWQFFGGIVAIPTLFYKQLNHVLLPLSFLIGTVSAICLLLALTKTKISIILEAIKTHFSAIQLILAVCCWFFFLPLAELCTGLIPTDGLLEELYKSFEKTFNIMLNYKIAGFITICILAPIFEEIIFRGIILKGMLNHKVKPVIAIFVSGLIFGLAHMNPWQFIGAGILGMIFGFIYYRTKSLFLTMLLHFLNNTLSYILMLVYGDMEGEIFHSSNHILMLALTLFGILSLFTLYKNTKNN
ncbi:type II CAAX endopeptidase family protein [Chishuiella sp.]|uniref:CPBP family intramembrane glutamic endopeptidase n=1 Tax=Chishuiella sp. TaxID=1969467 RepID=UPI0028AB4329|nr:type II CAAX endopeptidase family protein [Chishuiella sp.]